MRGARLNPNTTLTAIDTPQGILRAGLAALSEGNISGAVDHFDDDFTFVDHGLRLEFTDKGRLIKFFQKAREIFPDTVIEVASIFESGYYAIAEWKLSATQTVPYGSISHRFPILLPGSTIVQIKHGRIARWSDYYDRITSRRVNLAAFFTEWIEY